MTYVCYAANCGVTQNQYSKYHINPWNSLQDIRQNRWSMKIWSQWPWLYSVIFLQIWKCESQDSLVSTFMSPDQNLWVPLGDSQKSCCAVTENRCTGFKYVLSTQIQWWWNVIKLNNFCLVFYIFVLPNPRPWLAEHKTSTWLLD